MLSLQAKLDQIAREREVLSVLQSLLRVGLREGDSVCHAVTGALGRVAIRRDEGEPVAVVRTESGPVEAFDATLWRLP